MKKTIADYLNTYFYERQKLNDFSDWIGKSISSSTLKPTYFAIKELSSSLNNIISEMDEHLNIKFSLGQGRATPDHYIALLPDKQKVSNGIYLCMCFNREGTGCVLGAMTSLSMQSHQVAPLIQRANLGPEGKKRPWEMLYNNNVDIREKNNAFFNPIEILAKDIIEDKNKINKLIEKHLLHSISLVHNLIQQSKKNNRNTSNTINPIRKKNSQDENIQNNTIAPITVKAKIGDRVKHETMGIGTIKSLGCHSLFYVKFDSGDGMNFFSKSLNDGTIKIL